MFPQLYFGTIRHVGNNSLTFRNMIKVIMNCRNSRNFTFIDVLTLENILPRNQVMEAYVVEHDFVGLGQRRMVLNARRIVTAMGNTELILLAMVAIEPLQKP